MSKFSHRSEQEEIMDDLTSSGNVMEQTLQELEVINKRLGGDKVTVNGLEKLLRGVPSQQPITIADVGCGRGDILVAVARRMSSKFPNMQLVGIDANPHIIDMARRKAVQHPQIRFECIDILTAAFRNQTYDIITCSLFTHHFKDSQLVDLFISLNNQTALGVVINDLHRHWVAYYAIKGLVNSLSRSPMVRHDAPVSVLRAFRRRDFENILKEAGIYHYTLKWMWAFRWQLVFGKKVKASK